MDYCLFRSVKCLHASNSIISFVMCITYVCSFNFRGITDNHHPASWHHQRWGGWVRVTRALIPGQRSVSWPSFTLTWMWILGSMCWGGRWIWQQRRNSTMFRTWFVPFMCLPLSIKLGLKRNVTVCLQWHAVRQNYIFNICFEQIDVRWILECILITD